MIGPVSGTGRAMMASLQQAIQKGMPPDQAIQYVKSMATEGVAPLADLYAMMNQFQRLKQQPVQAPQTPPTIRDQLNMAEQQRAMQQMAMQRGLGGLPAPVMEQAQFAGGGIVAFAAGSEGPVSSGNPAPYDFNDDLMAGIPAGLTENMDIISFVRKQMPNFDALSPEQKQEVLTRFDPMYRRGIASLRKLSQRGAVPAEAAAPSEVLTPFSQEAFRQGSGSALDLMRERELATERAAPTVAPPRDTAAPPVQRRPAAAPAAAVPKQDMFSQFERAAPTLESVRAERIERQRAAKTGEFSQADADLAAFIKEQKAQGGDTKEAYRNFWVMTGASLMANKSPYFMQALGESIKENYGGLVNDLKQLKDNTKTLRLQEIQLRRAQEQAMESGSAADQARVDKLSDAIYSTNFDIAKQRATIADKALDRQHDFVLERLRASNRSRDRSMAEQLMAMYDAVQKEPDPAKRQAMQSAYEKRLAAAEDIIRSTTATGLTIPVREAGLMERVNKDVKATRAYQDAERRYRVANMSGDIAGADAAKSEMDQLEAGARQRVSSYLSEGASSVPTMGGGTYSGPYTVGNW